MKLQVERSHKKILIELYIITFIFLILCSLFFGMCCFFYNFFEATDFFNFITIIIRNYQDTSPYNYSYPPTYAFIFMSLLFIIMILVNLYYIGVYLINLFYSINIKSFIADEYGIKLIYEKGGKIVKILKFEYDEIKELFLKLNYENRYIRGTSHICFQDIEVNIKIRNDIQDERVIFKDKIEYDYSVKNNKILPFHNPLDIPEKFTFKLYENNLEPIYAFIDIKDRFKKFTFDYSNSVPEDIIRKIRLRLMNDKKIS